VVICLKQGTNNLHTVQLMSSLASDWFNLSLASLHRQSWKKEAIKQKNVNVISLLDIREKIQKNKHRMAGSVVGIMQHCL